MEEWSEAGEALCIVVWKGLVWDLPVREGSFSIAGLKEQGQEQIKGCGLMASHLLLILPIGQRSLRVRSLDASAGQYRRENRQSTDLEGEAGASRQAFCNLFSVHMDIHHPHPQHHESFSFPPGLSLSFLHPHSKHRLLSILIHSYGREGPSLVLLCYFGVGRMTVLSGGGLEWVF